MSKIDPHLILPCLTLLFGTTGLGSASIYALTLPGLSFIGGAEQRLTTACDEFAGCNSVFFRRNERLEGLAGVQVVFVTSNRLTERGKSELTTVVDQNTRRPGAVSVSFETSRFQTTAAKSVKANMQATRGVK